MARSELTVDLGLKVLIVKSANDVAVMLAEKVGGSQEGFVAQMNQAAQRLGMTRTTFVNANLVTTTVDPGDPCQSCERARTRIHAVPSANTG